MAEGSDVRGVIGHMKKNGSFKIIIIGFILGIVLLIVGSISFNDKDESGSSDGSDEKSYSSFLEYKRTVEEEIENICMSVSGVSKVSAVVIFDGVGESLYAQNTQSGNYEKNEYVIIGSGSHSHALYLGESLPQLEGIGIVCDTGGDIALRNEIAALLSAAYGIPMTRIYVSEGG